MTRRNRQTDGDDEWGLVGTDLQEVPDWRPLGGGPGSQVEVGSGTSRRCLR